MARATNNAPENLAPAETVETTNQAENNTQETEKAMTNPEAAAPVKPELDLVDLFVERDPSDENPNLVICVNGKNFVMPRGQVSRVPKYIKDEYDRAKRAQYKADQTVAERKGIKAAN